MVDKGWFVEYPISVLNTAVNSVQQASFSMIKDAFTIKPMFSFSYIPQQVYNLFSSQNCAPVSTYVQDGYNFLSATTFQCTANGDAVFGCANVAPNLDYCPYVCQFSIAQNISNCFNAVATQAYNYVQQEQDEQNKSDEKKLIIGGAIIGAAALCCAVGIWRYRKNRANTHSETEKLQPSQSNYGSANPV